VDFYKVYRALVRAKVTAIRLAQPDLAPDERAAVLAAYGRYLSLAEGYTRKRGTALIITHGVSGSGKTLVSSQLLEIIPVIRLRSDVERKRLYGLQAGERSGSPPNGGIYAADATARTYSRLHELARLILDAGYSALIDATFLMRSQREAFYALAHKLGKPMLILSLEASVDQLREQVLRRQAKGDDASEAGINVLEHQLRNREPLSDAERLLAVTVDAGAPLPLERILQRYHSLPD
jgi:predicted kinase